MFLKFNRLNPYLWVGGQLSSVDDHGAAHGGDGAPPEDGDALLLDDPQHGVDDVLVVSALGQRQSTVRRHPDEAHLGGRPDEGAAGAGGDAAAGFRQKSGRFPVTEKGNQIDKIRSNDTQYKL